MIRRPPRSTPSLLHSFPTRRSSDLNHLLFEHHRSGHHLIFEGAQGILLDVDLGTYPYVTSSNTTAGAAATGTGFGPRYFDEILGVGKVYATRVGHGPFPTELTDEAGKYLAERGQEYGSVTGRPRRCGWFDAVQMRQVVLANSLTGLVLTKLDILDELEKIYICTGYRYQNQILTMPSYDPEVLVACKPIYEELPGWQSSTRGLTRYDQLPQRARDYIARIESLSGTPIVMLSTGPERKQIISLRKVL